MITLAKRIGNIHSERGDPGDSEYKGMLGIIRSIAFRRIQGFVFQSEGAKDFFTDTIKKKATVIPNPISVPEGDYTAPCKDRIKKIVNVGRLHPQKNQALLIEAFSKMSSDLAKAIIELSKDKSKQYEMGRKARTIVQRFESKIIAQEYSSLYDSIMKKESKNA